MRIVTTSLAFVLMFLLSFVLAGLFLMPHLPPTPKQAVTPFEGAFWTDNWAGAVAGLLLGGLSARSTWRRSSRGERAVS
ncbi:MAG: hypothetical protein U0638_00940 [Phycisphaerales bacterium]